MQTALRQSESQRQTCGNLSSLPRRLPCFKVFRHGSQGGGAPRKHFRGLPLLRQRGKGSPLPLRLRSFLHHFRIFKPEDRRSEGIVHRDQHWRYGRRGSVPALRGRAQLARVQGEEGVEEVCKSLPEKGSVHRRDFHSGRQVLCLLQYRNKRLVRGKLRLRDNGGRKLARYPSERHYPHIGKSRGAHARLCEQMPFLLQNRRSRQYKRRGVHPSVRQKTPLQRAFKARRVRPYHNFGRVELLPYRQDYHKGSPFRDKGTGGKSGHDDHAHAYAGNERTAPARTDRHFRRNC